jgi:hypothetical protein
VHQSTHSVITQSVALLIRHQQTRHEREPFHIGTGPAGRTDRTVCRRLLYSNLYFFAPSVGESLNVMWYRQNGLWMPQKCTCGGAVLNIPSQKLHHTVECDVI